MNQIKIKNLHDRVDNHREEITKISEEQGAKNIRVFGSVICHEADVDSDIVFIVYMEEDRRFFDLDWMLMGLQE